MIAKELKHPFIAEYKCFIHEYDKNLEEDSHHVSKFEDYKFQDAQNNCKDKYMTHLMLEHLGGKDLNHFINHIRSQLSEAELIEKARMFGRQIISALAFLYSRKIIHRDLKPHNIVLTEDQNSAKIIDLGFSMKFEGTKNSLQKVSGAGTPHFKSPEQWDDHMSLTTDIWAFGCIIFHFITGVKPYDGLDE